MVKRITITLIAAVVVVGFNIAALAWLAYRPLTLTRPVALIVRQGQSTSQIADNLDAAGALRSKRLFILWAKLRRVDRSLQPGRYAFSGPTSMDAILDALREGRRETITVTIPEGWKLDQIAERLAEATEQPQEAFSELVHDSDFAARWGIPQPHMEGYLLPETYTFFWGVEPVDVITHLAAASQRLFNDTVMARLDALGMTRHEVLTMASMVEAETGTRDEYATIAGVFHNRLRKKMLLQCDPTVIYAMGGLKPGRILWSNDLKIDSPYNTYVYPGLPPGPICNPGKQAIMAALYPDTTEYLYFVADGSGGHIFSRTLSEHNRARVRVKEEQGGK